MKELLVYITLSIVFFSCNSTKDLLGQTFKYKSKSRILELHFKNDKDCVLKNKFKCDDIDEDLKIIHVSCSYRREGNKIILSNKNNDNNEGLFLNITKQNSKDCSFLNQKAKPPFTPNYTTDFDKYGIIPAIDTDTLYIYGNKILLYKQNQSRSIGFIFR
ncbi:hypothetical protein [Wenyingzhuangia sp. IMCC45574]